MRASDTSPLQCLCRRRTRWRETTAMDTDANNPEDGPGRTTTARPPAEELENALFDSLRQHVESMILWARGEEAQTLEHYQVEERVLADGYEVMRLHTEALMAVKTARETRRDDVVDADGDPRVTVEE